VLLQAFGGEEELAVSPAVLLDVLDVDRRKALADGTGRLV